MSKSYLLINEPPLTVSPTLATIIGLDEAILIQQVHYWLMNQKNAGRMEEGEKWVYNTYEEWQESNFPFWSVDKVQRLFLKLEKQGLIISRQFDAKNRDMRKFYRLAYDEICMLHDSFLLPSIDAKLHDVNGTETTTETNTCVDQTDGVTRPVSKDDHPSSFSNINSGSSFNRVKRVNTPKGDLVDLELSKLPAISIRKAISDYFKLNTNWDTKYNRQWMEWAVETKITAEQIERAADTWRSDKQFNWQVPTLKGIFEKWQMLMEAAENQKSDFDWQDRSHAL